ncbi:MAG TPA: lysine--tRNA ligase [Solirubrobacteraceae bacterium]|nr:lysine--tRNA ligase [Solirubrobacteraceae bacterium]
MSDGDVEASALLAARRAKLERLRAEGVDPFPHDFDGVEAIESVLAAHEGLKDGEETTVSHRVAGRLAARRDSGKAAFLDLVDRSGRIQLHARVDELGEQAFERLLSLDIGDLLGVDGVAIRTRRGQLSLRVTAFTLLAKSLRPPPDDYHGLSDVETRFRRRELDLIANPETRELFVARAAIISAVRRSLDDDGFIEVETPVLQPLYGGAAARPFLTHHNALDRTLYLRIATELYLKRAIVGGLERVYELGKDFRNEGLSPKHNPEFTMVEWYEAYADYEDAAARLEKVVAAAAAAVAEPAVDFSAPWRRVTLAGAIAEQTGIDVLAERSREALVAAIEARGLSVATDGRSWAGTVDELLSSFVEPTLQQPTFVFDYPVELSPLAKAHRSKPGLVERWEAYAGGIEISNAFSELNDPDEQRERFLALHRDGTDAESDEAPPLDEAFLAALEQGMPPTAGVGLGIDRLVMLLCGRRAIREVVLFPAMRDA